MKRKLFVVNNEKLWKDMRINFSLRYTQLLFYKLSYGILFRRTYNFDERIDAFFAIMNSMYQLEINQI